MEVKKEPVDREYNEEDQPPDDAWFHVPIVQTEALETFEDASLRIKSELQTNIGQSISKEEVGLKVSAINCKVSENSDKSISFASGLKNQIPAAHNSASSLRTLFDYSHKTSQASFDDIKIDVVDVKKEVSIHQPVVVAIKLEKRLFYERNFVCSVCMQIFASFDLLSLHRNVHNKSMFSFSTNESVNPYGGPTLRLQLDPLGNEKTYILKLLHTTEKHCDVKSVPLSNFKSYNLSPTGEKPFECDQCDYKSARRSTLTQHKLSHTDKKPFKCDQCGYKYAQKRNLKTHKLSHTGEKPFECDQCDSKFRQKSDLKSHKLSHTVEKPFECDQCDYKFTRLTYLNTHKQSHSGEKPFECDQCGSKFAWRPNLKTHKLLHTGEKPFNCDQCDYKSATRSTLKKHKLSHTGEKPFECDQCDKKFRQAAHLKNHRLSHTGEKPFECDQCDYKFTRRTYLNTHKLSHTD